MGGVAFIVAVTVVAEVGDFHRFDNPRRLIAYLGLIPSEPSSGTSVRRGGVTKAGSGLARRALIEGAWSYRMQARVGPKLHDRIEAPAQGRWGQPVPQARDFRGDSLQHCGTGHLVVARPSTVAPDEQRTRPDSSSAVGWDHSLLLQSIAAYYSVWCACLSPPI
ncbi:transposase [Sinorhizobium fredii]